MLLFPEQDRLANAQGCWNWFDTRTGGRRPRRRASSRRSIRSACCTAPIRRGWRSPGLSAGAGMAALLALAPSRSASGPSRCTRASRPAPRTRPRRRSSAMRGRRRARGRWPDGAALPPLLVIQGGADHVVAPSNGAGRRAGLGGGRRRAAGAPRTVQRGQRRADGRDRLQASGRARRDAVRGARPGPRLERRRGGPALQRSDGAGCRADAVGVRQPLLRSVGREAVEQAGAAGGLQRVLAAAARSGATSSRTWPARCRPGRCGRGGRPWPSPSPLCVQLPQVRVDVAGDEAVPSGCEPVSMSCMVRRVAAAVDDVALLGQRRLLVQVVGRRAGRSTSVAITTPLALSTGPCRCGRAR